MAHPERSSLQAYLAKLTGHTVLTAQEQETILSLPFHIEQVAANRDFVSLGESVDHVSVIASGFVGRFDQNSNGERQITAIHVPGDAANLHSVVQPQAASALQSLSASTVLRIPHQAIRAVAARHPAVAEALWRDCIVDAAISSQWIVNVGRRDAQSRIGHLFCELAIRLGATTGGNSFTFPFLMTQIHLADATGLTNVHVNRVLRSFRDADVVQVQQRAVMVHDWDRLTKLGDFDPGYLQTDIMPGAQLRIVST